MREYIKRERRVELFYEGKRPWTCRLYLEPTSREELSKESIWRSSGSDNSERTQNIGLQTTDRCRAAKE